MTALFNPKTWYWQDAGGRVYSGARQAIVTVDDAEFVAWQAIGNVPLPWPTDSIGAQTDAALQAVIAIFGLYLPTPAGLLAYAANARFNKEIAGLTVDGSAIATDRGTQAQVTGAYNFLTANPSLTLQWKAADGSWATVNLAAITAIANAIAGHVQACFAAEATLDAGINATPATVTTFAQIDAAIAAVTP